jgi:hypothetical protein
MTCGRVEGDASKAMQSLIDVHGRDLRQAQGTQLAGDRVAEQRYVSALSVIACSFE